MTLLMLENVQCAIDGNAILRGVDLTIARGEILGLVGESGSGKSMTALAIARLLPDRASLTGSMHFDGADLLRADEDMLCQWRGAAIGFVFQEPMTALNPLKRIGDQIAEVFMLHTRTTYADALDRTRSLMDRVGLQEIPATRFPHELSGGQRQRVVIAMAVACRPKLIIADEPTSALDVTTQAQILRMLKELARENGSALLLISHDLAVVASMADRIAVMKDGQIVETGETLSFFGAMENQYSRALYAATTYRPKRHRNAVDTAEFFVARHCTRLYAQPRLFWPAPKPVCAVDHVSLSIAPGENVGLVGESGSGKSTLARALLGLDPLSSGEISLHGKVLDLNRREDRVALRQKVQMVFQDPYASFDPRRTIGWSLAEPLTLLDRPLSTKEQQARVDQLLLQVGLSPDFALRYPHQMSGGQRQRAAIARALMTDPELIILDEPVSALDVSVRAKILDLLATLQQDHAVSYLFITHDLSLLRAVTDRAFVMQQGRIVEEGVTETILNDPQNPYTQSLVAAAPDLQTIIAARGGAVLAS